MKVGVIITAFNAERFLNFAVQSVLEQTHADLQCVIVDGGSTDNTPALCDIWAASDPRITVVHRPNGGLCVARNTGIDALHRDCEAVLFLDYDDVLHDIALETLGKLLEDKVAVAAHGTAILVDEFGKRIAGEDFAAWCAKREAVAVNQIEALQLDLSAPTTFASLVVRGNFPPSAYLIRRSTVQRIGGFDPEVDGAEDWDYWIRASRLGAFVFTAQPVVDYRRHSSNATLNLKRINAAVRRVRKKTVSSAENSEEHLKLLRAAHCLRHRRRMLEKRNAAIENLASFRPVQSLPSALASFAHALLLVWARVRS